MLPMTTAIFLAIFVCLNRVSVGIACPSDWVEAGSSCFKYFSTSTSPANAETQCQSITGLPSGVTPHLATIASQTENDILLAQWRTKNTYPWIGLKRAGSGWAWQDGMTSTYFNWHPSDPDGGDCVVIRLLTTTSSPGTWADASCLRSTRQYVCSYKQVTGQDALCPTTAPVSGAAFAAAITVGTRVMRSPDWKWGTQDGGVGSRGNIIRLISNGWIRVRWDNGHQNGYRMGAEGKYDLMAAPGNSTACTTTTPAPVPVCTMVPIVLTGPEIAEKLSVGTRVVRGKDWSWGTQDGTPPGPGSTTGAISSSKWVSVRWDTGSTYNYRMGASGDKYDLDLADPPMKSVCSSNGTAPVSPYKDCIDSWSAIGPFCYKFFRTLRTFAAAESYCAGQLTGAHLATIASLEDNRKVQKQFRTSSWVWIGLSDRAVVHDYTWTNGDPVSFYNWRPPNEPSSGSDDCVAMYLTDGTWADFNCGSTRFFLCSASREVNECSSSPCMNGGSCADGNDTFTCTCQPGYQGPTCETVVKACLSRPCRNGGSCHDTIGSFICICPAGYTGARCHLDINECISNPCENGARCSHRVNGFNCFCRPGYVGKTCSSRRDACLASRCRSGSTCINMYTSYKCICAPGYTGTYCTSVIKHCDNAPCENNGTCTDVLGSYTCSCPEGYRGDQCEKEIHKCESEPCMNGGQCLALINGYLCSCVSGFTGINCDTDIDECTSMPCLGGGVCTDQVDGFSCACVDGLTGARCEEDVNECASDPCQNGGSCIDLNNGHACRCDDDHAGKYCEIEVHICEKQPCKHNAVCLPLVNGDFHCLCKSGYAGKTCSLDINECASVACQNGGICEDLHNAFACACTSEYTGKHCETAVNQCDTVPCKNNGTCNDGHGMFTCDCRKGFKGKTCNIEKHPCEESPCLNGGSCVALFDGGFFCRCAEGYTGPTCAAATQPASGSPQKQTASSGGLSSTAVALLVISLILICLLAVGLGIMFYRRRCTKTFFFGNEPINFTNQRVLLRSTSETTDVASS